MTSSDHQQYPSTSSKLHTSATARAYPPSPILGRRPRGDELPRFAGATVPDLIGPGLRLLFVGINPSLWSAAVGAHFARPGNRFWPALAAAGVTPHALDCSTGMENADATGLVARGIGITNVVERATARADGLSRAELESGGARLVARVTAWRPRVVAVLGVTAYRQAFDPKAQQGRQDPPPGAGPGAQWWVLPNPSGLNAHETVESLGRAYADVARRAGVLS